MYSLLRREASAVYLTGMRRRLSEPLSGPTIACKLAGMDINDIAAKAAAKIDAARDAKVNAVKTAAASSVELADAVKSLAAAEQKYAKDYQAALRADWSESDLRGFGLEAPNKKFPGRPRGRKPARQTATQDHAVAVGTDTGAPANNA